MKQSRVLFSVFLFLTIRGIGQENKARDIEIPVLTVGTAKQPIKLTKQQFERDTVYNLTFPGAHNGSGGETSTQGFFKAELKVFGKALQTALSTAPGNDIHYKDGTIEILGSKFKPKQFLVRFSTGTGSFITTETDVKKMTDAIKKVSH